MIPVPTLAFAKYQGLGNDFIVIDARRAPAFLTSAAAARLCERRRGIGADGVLTLLPPRTPGADLRMHIFNADGSVPEMCGNGLRCVVRFTLGAEPGAHLSVDTDAGRREGWLERDGRVRVTLGTARLLAAEVDTGALGEGRRGVGISMGNPHLVLRPTPSDGDPLALARRLGPALERHPQFPDRTNVGFLAAYEVNDAEALRLVVFERGAGLTEACGTGAGAAAVAAVRWGLVRGDRRVRVELPGGPLEIGLDGDPRRDVAPGEALAEVEITGDAVRVFAGTVEVEPEALQRL